MSADWSTLFSPSHGYSDLAASGELLSPFDGRYHTIVEPPANHLSETGLNRARVHVEIKRLLYLFDKEVLPGAPSLSNTERECLRALPHSFSGAEIQRLAHFEATTRHDVKIVEYLTAEHLDKTAHVLGSSTCLPDLRGIVHIFRTSENIDDLAYALIMKTAIEQVWLSSARALLDRLHCLDEVGTDVPILAHTHGQPATPVIMGEEMTVFAHRFARQIRRVKTCGYLGKVDGATSTWAAHIVSVPGADWPKIVREFIEGLGLSWNPITTQIESHDWRTELCSDVARAGRIAHSLATDYWTYISMGYFCQNLAAQDSTGSSTMSHKVNPIRFESAEANLEVSGTLLDSLASTLVTSRMQRNLTDSTTQRNTGIALRHSILTYSNLVRGFDGIDLNVERMTRDLGASWTVLGEAVQQAMHAAAIAGHTGIANPYEHLEELTRDHEVDTAAMRNFVSTLGLPAEVEKRLLALIPANYIGAAPQITRWVFPRERQE